MAEAVTETAATVADDGTSSGAGIASEADGGVAAGWDGVTKSDSLAQARARNPHLDAYLERWVADGNELPEWHPTVSRDLKDAKHPNIIYPVGDPVFIHVYHFTGVFGKYHVVEPTLEGNMKEAYDLVRDRAFVLSSQEDPPDSAEEYGQTLSTLIRKATHVVDRPRRMSAPWMERYLPLKERPVQVTAQERAVVEYFIKRDIIGQGRMEPLMMDPYIEDIHGLGLRPVHCVHKIFEMLETSIVFPTNADVDGYVIAMGDRMGRPVSDSNPVVDGALPDGSRINIIYSNEISRGGSSFTIRKFAEVPIPVTQIVAWNTFSPEVAAYLWLCLENGMSVFVAGETASGKTTSTNSILPFINPQSKILTAEDTPEVLPPHENWQQLVTRETGPEEARVNMYTLLKAALRSRPDYVIVGEIRGAEGAVAFQAMQTGHATMATFHASSVGKLIQRFTSAPISVPAQFMDNLNVVLIQMAVYVGGRMLRRVLAVDELEGFSKQTGGVITRGVFTWNPVNDSFNFSGRNNSYVLEELVAPKMGLSDKRDIYKVLDRRAEILRRLIDMKVFDYFDVQKILFEFSQIGERALPFKLD